jgi:CRP-like cAMP-binding protein
MQIEEWNANALLGAVEPDIAGGFRSHFTALWLGRNSVLSDIGDPVEKIYFPLKGLVGVFSETVAGECVQSGMIGCDGAVGIVEVLGSGQYLSKSIVQIPGRVASVSAYIYRRLFEASPKLRLACRRYMELTLMEARQVLVCNALHPLEARLARSILDVLDKSCMDDTVPLTQESLASMLGAQRTTIVLLLKKLQEENLVRKRRGVLEVRDRSALARRACSCRETLVFAREEIQSITEPAPAHVNFQANVG